MKVLVASKFWYLRGGLERVMFSEIAGLESRGIEVAHFSTSHPLNVESPWSAYFAPYLELGGGTSLNVRDSSLAAARMFSNAAASRRFGELLDAFGADVVHIHGIHRQLSPSILFAARRRGVPVVQTLHDAHHVCPADVLLRGGVEVCDPRRCGTLNYLPAVANRCVRRSLAASALSAAETTFQRARRAYERTISRFIAPSRYLANLMEQGGWCSIPIDVVPNGVVTPSSVSRSPRGYFLYSGRLSAEKGVDVALRAAAQAGFRMIVAGDGPLAEDLKAQFCDAEFVGHVSSGTLADLLDGATAAVVPSQVPENAPMSVMEAMAHGVPVIASRRGGMPELVDAESGILVAPGDVAGLADAMRDLVSDSARAARLGLAGREKMAREYTLDGHVQSVIEVYERALAQAEEPQ